MSFRGFGVRPSTTARETVGGPAMSLSYCCKCSVSLETPLFASFLNAAVIVLEERVRENPASHMERICAETWKTNSRKSQRTTVIHT